MAGFYTCRCYPLLCSILGYTCDCTCTSWTSIHPSTANQQLWLGPSIVHVLKVADSSLQQLVSFLLRHGGHAARSAASAGRSPDFEPSLRENEMCQTWPFKWGSLKSWGIPSHHVLKHVETYEVDWSSMTWMIWDKNPNDLGNLWRLTIECRPAVLQRTSKDGEDGGDCNPHFMARIQKEIISKINMFEPKIPNMWWI